MRVCDEWRVKEAKTKEKELGSSCIRHHVKGKGSWKRRQGWESGKLTCVAEGGRVSSGVRRWAEQWCRSWGRCTVRCHYEGREVWKRGQEWESGDLTYVGEGGSAMSDVRWA